MAFINSKTHFDGSNPGSQDFFKLTKDLVVLWLDDDVKRFMIDYYALRNGYNEFGISNLFDYSYLITPAFKALEGTLLQIANELGFDLNKYEFKIGVVFSDDNLNKFYEDVLSKLDDLDDECKQDVQMWLNDARRLLRHFRHSPAHFLGEKKETPEVAFQFGDHIMRIIDEMCFSLLKCGIIGKKDKN